jgi:hypothetical protein
MTPKCPHAPEMFNHATNPRYAWSFGAGPIFNGHRKACKTYRGGGEYCPNPVVWVLRGHRSLFPPNEHRTWDDQDAFVCQSCKDGIQNNGGSVGPNSPRWQKLEAYIAEG